MIGTFSSEVIEHQESTMAVRTSSPPSISPSYAE